jgi:hypothetical protein
MPDRVRRASDIQRARHPSAARTVCRQPVSASLTPRAPCLTPTPGSPAVRSSTDAGVRMWAGSVSAAGTGSSQGSWAWDGACQALPQTTPPARSTLPRGRPTTRRGRASSSSREATSRRRGTRTTSTVGARLRSRRHPQRRTRCPGPAVRGENCLVGMAGFEPATSSSRTRRAAKLRYIPSITVRPGQRGGSNCASVALRARGGSAMMALPRSGEALRRAHGACDSEARERGEEHEEGQTGEHDDRSPER